MRRHFVHLLSLALTTSATAEITEAAVHSIVAVGKTAVQLIQNELELPFAEDKAVALASNQETS